MRMLNFACAAGLVAALLSSAAYAAEGTLSVTPGTGANLAITALDGASNASAIHGLCGGASGTMGTACNSQAIVSSGAVSTSDGTSHTTLSTIATNTTPTATGSGVPANANYVGANSSGNLTGIVQADGSAAINISTATTTQLVALSSGKKIYVTAWDVIAGGTGNITLEYGTGSNCGTGTTVLTGAYPLTAQAGLTKGNGLGAILVVPASNALCALTSQAVQMSGSVSYTQF